METKDLNEVLNFTAEEKLEIERDMIHLDIMEQVDKIKGELTRKGFATRLGISPAFVSQLFAGNKVINLELMAKIQREFGVKFRFNFDKGGQRMTVAPDSEPVSVVEYGDSNVITLYNHVDLQQLG